MPKNKLGKVPIYLRELKNVDPENPYLSEETNVYEWIPTNLPRGDINRPGTPGGKYLGWDPASFENVFYFADHDPKKLEKPYEQKLWDVYHWYAGEAKRLNMQIDQHNVLVDKYNQLERTGFKTTADSQFVDFERTIPATVTPVGYPKLTVPIQGWLQEQVDAYNKETNDIVSKLDNYNFQLEKIVGKKVPKTTKEEEEDKRFLKLTANINGIDRQLTANINQLRTDVMQRLNKHNNLFSELSSVHDEDTKTIAQFNEALMENSKLEMSMQSDVTALQKDVKSTQQDIASLRMYESSNSKGIQKNRDDIRNLTQIVKKKLPTDISGLRQDVSNLLNQTNAIDAKNQAKFTTLDKALKENQRLYNGVKKGLQNHKEHIEGAEKRLDEIKKAYYAEQNKLEQQLKEQERVNKTYFDAYKAQNDVYEKDVSQLKFELDKQDSESKEQGKRNEARFKTLFEYHAYTDQQVKKQNKKTSNFAQLKRIRQMPDKAIALKNYRRGRYALLQEYV